MMGRGMMGGMMGRGMMGGYWRNPSMFFPFGGLIMWLLILIIIGVVIYFIVRTRRGVSGRNYISSRDETPLEIAKKRYARGEISREEYETIKQNL
ncbi:MAG: SHOCT domain-containing protein [Spirochaetes bacterium]|nr:SHOCT domain-containing protein [Spirochaetota bacterium]